MRSLYPTPKQKPPASRPGSRQSDLSATGEPEGRSLRRKISATILTRAPLNRIAAPPPSRTGPPLSRNALRPRDQNASLTRPPQVATSMCNPKVASPSMPFDKDPMSSRKPPMPTIAKQFNRAPITPKVASRTAASQPQTVTLATPLARRTQNPTSATKSEITPASGGLQRDRDEVASPVSAFLGNNVTPRSGSRQHRVDSGTNSPNGTPNPDRADTWETRSGLGISASGLDERLRQTPTFSPPPEVGRAPQSSSESKFFFARDAKPTPPSRPPLPVQKSATFCFANGEAIPERQAAGAAAPSAYTPVLGSQSPTPDPLGSKFIYANGVPDLQPPLKTTVAPSRPSSVVSMTSRPPSRPATGPPTSNPLQRPTSPVRLAPSVVSKPIVQAQVSNNRAAMASAPQLALATSVFRQPIVESLPRSAIHTRHGSITTADSPILSRPPTSYASGSSSPSLTANPAAGLVSVLEAAADLDQSDDGRLYSEVHSPTKSAQPQDELGALVTNARRERKVQDLEITNASLEAINRSLERQLRKQKAEIRQFRRLSRTGRLSMASRISSTSTVEGPLNDPNQMLSDLSEEESEPEDDDPDESDYSESESTSGSSQLSPGIVAKRDARHRKQDEKRLQLDLSKHRELLVDSQKMNQSLKRCLNWTEELIKEGKKALEFQVRVSEVEIGGRVLAPLDEEDDDVEAAGEGVPEDDTLRLRVDENSH